MTAMTQMTCRRATEISLHVWLSSAEVSTCEVGPEQGENLRDLPRQGLREKRMVFLNGNEIQVRESDEDSVSTELTESILGTS